MLELFVTGQRVNSNEPHEEEAENMAGVSLCKGGGQPRAAFIPAAGTDCKCSPDTPHARPCFPLDAGLAPSCLKEALPQDGKDGC